MHNATSILVHKYVIKFVIIFAGYRIPKDWKVILWIRYIHTNSENFDNPMCFNPDRWDVSPHLLENYITKLNKHRFTHQLIVCLSNQLNLEHTKFLVADQEFVQEICLLGYNLQSYCIICLLDTSKEMNRNNSFA